MQRELPDGWVTMRPRRWRCLDEIYAGGRARALSNQTCMTDIQLQFLCAHL